ncbi:MAG: GNAT family N-acetyltransferase [Bacteroidota bacterium]
MHLQPTLENNIVSIRPLLESDFDSLYQVASDKEIWEQHPSHDRYQKEQFNKLFIKSMRSGAALLIIDQQSSKVIGSSRYQMAPNDSKTLEIGWSFLAKAYWGGKYNMAIKQLMIDHAFRHYEQVVFHIAKVNTRSIKAVEKLGATKITDAELSHLLKNPKQNWTYIIYKRDWLSK